MTKTEVAQQILTIALARLQAEGRQMHEVPDAEMAVILKEAAEDLKIALDVTGERIEG